MYSTFDLLINLESTLKWKKYLNTTRARKSDSQNTDIAETPLRGKYIGSPTKAIAGYSQLF